MKDFICPTCKRPTHPTDNEIIEHLTKEIDRYTEVLIIRTKELDRTRKALECSRHFLKEIRSLFLLEKDNPARQNKWVDTATRMWGWAEDALDETTALEQKD